MPLDATHYPVEFVIDKLLEDKPMNRDQRVYLAELLRWKVAS